MNDASLAAPASMCAPDPSDMVLTVDRKLFATVRVSSHIQAQGVLLKNLPDGRIAVQCGDAIVIGDRV